MKHGEKRPFEWACIGPYAKTPSYYHSFYAALHNGQSIVRAVLGHGDDLATHGVYIVERATGHTWTVNADESHTSHDGRTDMD